MDAYPLDVIEVIGVDEDRVDAGRPVSLRQRHDELFRRQLESLVAAIDERKQSPESCGAQ